MIRRWTGSTILGAGVTLALTLSVAGVITPRAPKSFWFWCACSVIPTPSFNVEEAWDGIIREYGRKARQIHNPWI